MQRESITHVLRISTRTHTSYITDTPTKTHRSEDNRTIHSFSYTQSTYVERAIIALNSKLGIRRSNYSGAFASRGRLIQESNSHQYLRAYKQGVRRVIKMCFFLLFATVESKEAMHTAKRKVIVKIHFQQNRLSTSTQNGDAYCRIKYLV